MPSIQTNDNVRLVYTESGNPVGRPVVLIAGFKAAATSWMFQIPDLESRGFRVITLDTRGHGLSETVDYGNRMSRRGMDLANFLNALDLSDVTLVGGSMGGNTIWSYISLYGTGRVSGVVIVDQTPKMLNDKRWKHGFYKYTRDNAGTFFAKGVPSTGHGTPMLRRGKRLVHLIRAMKISPSSVKKASGMSVGELALLQDHALADWRDVITRMDVPSLFVAGAESELWPASHAKASAELNPLAHSAVMDKAGHAANIEQYKEFNQLLARFLAIEA